jgi:hypothetical protein
MKIPQERPRDHVNPRSSRGTESTCPETRGGCALWTNRESTASIPVEPLERTLQDELRRFPLAEHFQICSSFYERFFKAVMGFTWNPHAPEKNEDMRPWYIRGYFWIWHKQALSRNSTVNRHGKEKHKSGKTLGEREGEEQGAVHFSRENL